MPLSSLLDLMSVTNLSTTHQLKHLYFFSLTYQNHILVGVSYVWHKSSRFGHCSAVAFSFLFHGEHDLRERRAQDWAVVLLDIDNLQIVGVCGQILRYPCKQL